VSTTGWHVARQALSTLLVRQTLEHAAQHVPFYLEQGWDPSRFERLSDLARMVPVTEKAHITVAPHSFLSDADAADSFHCTSGTTGRRLTVYGNSAEADALAALLRLRSGSGSDAPEVALRLFPNTLRLFAPPARVGSGAYNLIVNFSLTQTHHQWFDNTDHLIEVLGQEYLLGSKARRISLVHATPPYLIDFITRQCLARGVDLRRFAVHSVALTGGFASTRLRRMVQRYWNAAIVSAYSCTEIRGEAPEIAGQPGVYLPGPTMHAEIVDRDTGEAVADGECGEVLLSSLAPFQVVMPLLRYRTGDMAQRVGLPGHPGSAPFALHVLGRCAHGVAIGSRGFVGTRDVIEAVSEMEEVPQFPYPRHRIVRDGASVRVDIECTDLPWRKRGPFARRIAQRVRRAIAARATSPPRVVAEPVVKGELSGFARLYPER